MNMIRIGKIVNAQGLKGEVKLLNWSDDPERFEYLDTIYVSDGAAGVAAYGIESVRYTSGSVILKLEGVEDRNAAEALKEKEVFMDEADLPELEEGEYYVRDIVGSLVFALDEDGSERYLGRLKDVRTNTAQDLYVVERYEEDADPWDESAKTGGELMIPGVEEFILNVDPEEKRITVKLPEGLEEL